MECAKGDRQAMAATVFLPGILMPATQRYAPLIAALGGGEHLITKELEVYAGDQPPPGYEIATEVDGLARFADQRALDAFHLYGHSAGGAIALAFAAAHPERLLSLALDEPATDFSAEDQTMILGDMSPNDLAAMPPAERMGRFARTLVKDEVQLPAPPSAPPGPEMANRPAGVLAFLHAVRTASVNTRALAAFDKPVYYSHGELSNPRWDAMATRLQALFPDITVERYQGLHHLNTSHTAEPARVAQALQALWARAAAAAAP
jgi:pimeloyl-ACP methyl ester carboxylesterase